MSLGLALIDRALYSDGEKGEGVGEEVSENQQRLEKRDEAASLLR